MTTWVSWQIGVYESGRSMNHIAEYTYAHKTLCGKIIPKNNRNAEIWWGYEGNNECERCQRSEERKDNPKPIKITGLDGRKYK